MQLAPNQKQIDIAHYALYGTIDIPAPPVPINAPPNIDMTAVVGMMIRRAGGGDILDHADDDIQYVYDVAGVEKALLTLYRRNPNVARITSKPYIGSNAGTAI